MFCYKKIIASFLFLTVASAAFADKGIPMFSITPFTTTATVTSNGQATIRPKVCAYSWNLCANAATSLTINISNILFLLELTRLFFLREMVSN